jgi:hypothetical protein
MKRLMIIAVLFISLTGYATPGKNSATPAERAFSKTFSNATEVSWAYSKDFAKADFMIGNQYATAFYTYDGKLMGLTRNITSLDLPLELQVEIKKEYQDFWITDLFELSDDNGVTYYATLENADRKIVLKAEAGYGWHTFQKRSK